MNQWKQKNCAESVTKKANSFLKVYKVKIVKDG